MYIPATNYFFECSLLLWQIQFEIIKGILKGIPRKDSYGQFARILFPFYF